MWFINFIIFKVILLDVMIDKKLCSLKSIGDIFFWRIFENINFENLFKNILSSCDGDYI